jgi:hypothetical protein
VPPSNKRCIPNIKYLNSDILAIRNTETFVGALAEFLVWLRVQFVKNMHEEVLKRRETIPILTCRAHLTTCVSRSGVTRVLLTRQIHSNASLRAGSQSEMKRLIPPLKLAVYTQNSLELNVLIVTKNFQDLIGKK